MNDLESRLRSLRDLPDSPAPTVVELRERARQNGRRRRITIVAAVVPIAAIVIGLIVWNQDEPLPEVRTVPVDTSVPNADNRSLGGVTGVSVTVTPNTGLRDGQLVEVRVSGLERLPSASLVMCAGDVTEQTAMSVCDIGAVHSPDAQSPTQPRAMAIQTVSVARFLNITHSSSGAAPTGTYDCATEPAGCVLAVGPVSLPARGVLTTLMFQDVPIATPAIEVDSTEGLISGQEVEVNAEGLRPNSAVPIRLCLPGGEVCDVYSYTDATSDGTGALSQRIRVWSVLYTWQGETLCTVESCAISVVDGSLPAGHVEVPISFAPGTPTPNPRLVLDPPGPYADGQEVTVRGSGFRPGIEISQDLGQCPADKDTRIEERCGYDLGLSVVADDEGRFTTTFRLSNSLIYTGSCVTGPGCVLGWVIPHGPTLAKVPLTFRE